MLVPQKSKRDINKRFSATRPLSSSKDAVVRVWSRHTLEPYCDLMGHEGPVNAVGLQGDQVISASGDGRMILWDLKTRSKVRTFEGHDRGLACVEFKVRGFFLDDRVTHRG